MSKLNLKDRGPGALLSLGCAALGVVCLAAYCVYGAVFDYFDTGVCIALLLAAACAGVYALADGKPLGALSLVSAACLSFALGLFFLNSFPVWADNLNGITMYASRGGLAPPSSPSRRSCWRASWRRLSPASCPGERGMRNETFHHPETGRGGPHGRRPVPLLLRLRQLRGQVRQELPGQRRPGAQRGRL